MVSRFYYLSGMYILRDITRFPDEKCPQLSKISNLDKVVIHVSMLMLIYPVKDSTDRGIVFSETHFFF